MTREISQLWSGRRAGLITIIFLASYRSGRKLLLLKRKGSLLVIPLYIVSTLFHKFLSMLIGCSVPFSSELGKRINFQHGLYGVFISGSAVVGDNCTILHQVTIGSNFGSTSQGAPVVGSNVFIGAGAKIIGPVSIGDFCKVGVNAVVIDNLAARQTVVAPKAHVLVMKSL